VRATHLAVAAAAVTAACGGLLGLDEDDDAPSPATSNDDGGLGDDGGSSDAFGGSDASSPSSYCATQDAAYCWDFDEGKSPSEGWYSVVANNGSFGLATDASSSPPASAFFSALDAGASSELTLFVPTGSSAIDMTWSALVPLPPPSSVVLAKIGANIGTAKPAVSILAYPNSVAVLDEPLSGTAQLPASSTALPRDRFVRFHFRVSFETQHVSLDMDGTNVVDNVLQSTWDKAQAYRLVVGVRQDTSVPGYVYEMFLDDVLIRFE